MSNVKTRKQSSEVDMVSAAIEGVLKSVDFQNLLRSNITNVLKDVLSPIKQQIDENEGYIHDLENRVDSLSKHNENLLQEINDLKEANKFIKKKH